jgi:protein-S-isoprenylcysteine O-methyltransferase Ste14
MDFTPQPKSEKPGKAEITGQEEQMDFSLSRQLINGLWILFGLYWLVSAVKRKKTKKRETWIQRSRYVLPLIVASLLLVRPEARYGWLGTRFVGYSLAVEWAGVLLTAMGVAVAVWARWHLGANWSGVVSLKEGHELIRTGPYRSIRHPIYTGILLALLGTVVATGEVRGIIAMLIFWLSFYWKARREESFLAQEFGPSFTEHLRHTGMFLPRFST